MHLSSLLASMAFLLAARTLAGPISVREPATLNGKLFLMLCLVLALD